MSLPQSDSADSDGEESQNYEHDLQSESSSWENIEIDENMMASLGRVIEEIARSTDNPPQIIEAVDAVKEVSSGIKAINVPLCLLARMTNPLLFSGYRTTKRIASGL